MQLLSDSGNSVLSLQVTLNHSFDLSDFNGFTFTAPVRLTIALVYLYR